MKASALLLLAVFALAVVSDGSVPGVTEIAVEWSEDGLADTPGGAEAHEAVVPVRALPQATAPLASSDALCVPTSWSDSSDVPPPEA